MKKLMLVLLGVLALGSAADAGIWRRARCCDPCAAQCSPGPCCVNAPTCVPATTACAPLMVERTVLEPVMVTETRKVQVTEVKHEPRVRNYTVTKLVPHTEMRTRTVAYSEMETRTRDEKYIECKTVAETVDQQFTVMVPYTETRKGTRCVVTPVTKDVEQTYTVMIPYTEVRKGTRCVVTPVTKNVEQTYVVNVPYTEQRTGTRTVWECVPVVQTRIVCEDQGHWEQRCIPVANGCQSCGVATRCCRPRRHHACGCDPCAPCASCAPAPVCNTIVTQNVWVPKIVQREVQCTVNTRQSKQVPYTCTVTLCKPESRTRTVQVCEMVRSLQECEYQVQLCKPETRSRTVQVCEMVRSEQPYEYQVQLCKPEARTRQITVCKQVPEEKTRTVSYAVCVPKTREEQYPVTVCDPVTEVKTETYTVCIPVCVEMEIQVQVCKMVEKKIMVPAAQPYCQPVRCCR